MGPLRRGGLGAERADYEILMKPLAPAIDHC